jgi:hypothetical protein
MQKLAEIQAVFLRFPFGKRALNVNLPARELL